MQRPPLQFAALAASSLQTVRGHDRCSGPSYLEMVAVQSANGVWSRPLLWSILP